MGCSVQAAQKQAKTECAAKCMQGRSQKPAAYQDQLVSSNHKTSDCTGTYGSQFVGYSVNCQQSTGLLVVGTIVCMLTIFVQSHV